MLRLATGAIASPAAACHRAALAAIGAEAVALMPCHERFRHGDGGEFVSRQQALADGPAQVVHRDIAARHQRFDRAGGNAHAEHRLAVAQAKEHRARVGAVIARLLQRQRGGGIVAVFPDQQRIAMHNIGARVAALFQGQQLVGVFTKMGRAIDGMSGEAR